jgi:hypothetical protein
VNAFQFAFFVLGEEESEFDHLLVGDHESQAHHLVCLDLGFFIQNDVVVYFGLVFALSLVVEFPEEKYV